MKKNKTYVGVMKIHKQIDEEKLKDEMKKFVGKIIQLPPVKSRVKREERERNVYSWDVLEFDKENKEVLFSCEVEAGTYVRKLISDLGLRIGGAHMIELRRIKAGIFSEDDKNFASLYELEKIVEEAKEGGEEKLRKLIIPAEVISEILPSVQVKESCVSKLLTGKPVFKEDLAEELKLEEGDIAVFFKNRLIEVGKIVDEGDTIIKPEWVKN